MVLLKTINQMNRRGLTIGSALGWAGAHPLIANAGTGVPLTPNPLVGLNMTAGTARIDTSTDLPTMVGVIIGSALVILGTVFLILIVYGGFMWMTSAGNDDRVRKAKSIIVASATGLAIILLAYLITALLGIIFGADA